MNERAASQLDDDLEPGGTYTSLGDQGEGESLFRQIQSWAQVLWRWKLLILVVLALGVAGGWFYLKQQPAVHRASATVLIDRNPPKILSNVSEIVKLGSPNDYRGDVLYFESQYQIIKSREVTERVLDRLQLWNSEHLLGLDRRDDLTGKEKKELLREAHMPSVLSSRLVVEPVKSSMLVRIHFEDTDPELARDVVNAVVEAYREQNVDYRRTVVEEATVELKALEDSLEEHYQEAEAEVRGYEREHEVGTIENSKKAIDERLMALGTRLTEVRIERIGLEAKAEAISRYTRARDITKISSGTLLDDQVIRDLKQQVAQLQAELEGLQVRYLDQHPEVAALKNRITSLTGAARTEIRNIARSVQKDYEEAQTIEAGLQEELQTAKAEERRITDVEHRYARLVEIRDQEKKQYEGIRERLQETLLTQKVETNNIRVLEKAVKAEQVAPRPAAILSWFFAGALALAIFLASLLEYLDSTIKDWKDLEERFGLKVLGVLPVISAAHEKKGHDEKADTGERDLHIHHHPTSQVAEASRSLRTNLLFMGTAKPLRTMVITSADPGEGKSTVAISASISLASSGTRTLLVEADMRRPRFAKTFSVDPERGLTSCLAGGAPLAEYAQQTVVDGLDVLVCGPIPPNPAELLHTDRFHELLEEMRERYDTVIFDTPPVLPVADALVLGSQVDGVLMVVRAGRTSRHALRHGLRQLQGVDANLIGMVLNHREMPRSRYGGGYTYRYGYGYGGYGYGKPYVAAQGD